MDNADDGLDGDLPPEIEESGDEPLLEDSELEASLEELREDAEMVPKDNPHLRAFIDEVWNRRPSGLVTLIPIPSAFHCEFSIDRAKFYVSGRIKLNELECVKDVSGVKIGMMFADKDGREGGCVSLAPYDDLDLEPIFAKLAEVFLDRTPCKPDNLIGEYRLGFPVSKNWGCGMEI